ncbi:methyltransferase domain-containing protein [Patescibacteria group bacterium]|nr:methyltransferase domain-containing protein [Patescibacteria group bacterium]
MNRCVCAGCDEVFGKKRVRKDVKRYHDEGLPGTTKILVTELERLGVTGKTLLDIGGGIGLIPLELLPLGVTSAVSLEASATYLTTAKEEAERQGVLSRITFQSGDFVSLAGNVGPADIVTLDKVVCCYADMEGLVTLSADRAQSLYALIYPRDIWWVKFAFALENISMRILGLPRYYVHPTAEVERILHRKNFSKVFSRYKGRWQIAIFKRDSDKESSSSNKSSSKATAQT